MTRILFGKRAVKKEKLDSDEIVYPVGSCVIGALYLEKADRLTFRLPNGRVGVVHKKAIENDLEMDERSLKISTKRMIPHFSRDLCVELLILGEKEGRYECTFFIQKSVKNDSIVTGLIEADEEMGYSVALGLPGKTAIVKTEKKHKKGALAVFQVAAVAGSTYLLRDSVDREVYIGGKEEVSPGVVVRTRITGRPKYILGDKRPKYTKMYYSYTADALGLGSIIVESKEELNEDDEHTSIIAFVSEDKSLVHAVPYEEYFNEVHKNLPSPDLVGKVFLGEVRSIEKNGVAKIVLDEVMHAVLYDDHFSDISRQGSLPPFSVGERITVRVYDVWGYSIVVTAKESLINAKNVQVPPKINTGVVGVVRRVGDDYLVCSTFGRVCINIKRTEYSVPEVGAVHYIHVKKLASAENSFKGTQIPREYMETVGEHAKKRDLLKEPRKKRVLWKDMAHGEREAHEKKKDEMRLKEIKAFKNGQIVTGKIINIHRYGAFVQISKHVVARVQIAEISSRFVQDWATLVHVGQRVKIVLFDIDYEAGKLEGSIKKYEVLSSIEAAPAEEARDEQAEHMQEPLAYAHEEESESESEDSEHDENMQMELFNSKDGVDPWRRRMQNAPPAEMLKVFKKALAYLQSPESKKEMCLIYAGLLGETSEALTEKTLAPIDEGVKRDGCTFLKKAIDTARNSQNRNLHRELCMRFVREKSESPFGYKELIFGAKRQGSTAELASVVSLLERAEMKASDRKAVEVAHAETLYHIAKNEGRAAMEKKIAKVENKAKEEWTIKYIALELGSIEKSADVAYARNLLHKSVSSTELPEAAVKSIFKTFLKFEKEYGTPENEAKVLDMAKEYVARAEK
ncbi:uncharacterized protein NEMAJ01_2196 [Nematocida major]|uniref:uncharacterized protein n=1 Tax=Nematocida major TaxID=1912982 RepID=UPI00200768C6|nr:uncharacterized protein NEMAJ01_2196 [Nematocida major]KAH9387300.1 hypothetical protein NEMAJ01_2196 [Nematocida major]